ncbi:hypothetical protein [Actinoplanes sp. NBRC 103695]|uniref:hypothetical protein n=1 Tax=Actinoplanes sp. NBRC 103695 TaxID=3032202 RepID=UPI00249FC334|nr:hypothetical protein [Actinoplanes sp. NBRC 103695]GLY94962.1 hypothetical protein Acsp02_22170 [Actinoplanes sp. NBRC 103695]
MSAAPEPFVVRRDPSVPDRLIRLADVLITAPDERPRSEQIAALFDAYPGLTLILVVGAGRYLVVGARDGTAATLRLGSSGSVRRAAACAYRVWIGQFGTQDPRP